jgi:uncharacterized SAM-binding protein YcdF (DUF218 family)
MTPQDITTITNYIFLESKLEAADLAFVFGTRFVEPLFKVKEIYTDGLVEKILLSGGKNRFTDRNEAQDMAAALIKMGITRKHLILEDKSTNSLENVLFSKSVIEQSCGWSGIKKIAVVCKHYHSRRAVMTLKRHFPPNIIFSVVPYEILGFTRENWFESTIGQEKVLSEWEKIPRYLARGDILELG